MCDLFYHISAAESMNQRGSMRTYNEHISRLLTTHIRLLDLPNPVNETVKTLADLMH
jgi:hypothetical protein